jgi:hypothetical protein
VNGSLTQNLFFFFLFQIYDIKKLNFFPKTHSKIIQNLQYRKEELQKKSQFFG